MPHFVAEYSRGIESVCPPREVMECLHSAALESGLFAEAAIKVRLVPVEHYLVGGKIVPFVHVTASILDGRSLDQKQDLTSLVLKRLKDQLGDALSITVDVRDTVRATYAKHSPLE